MAESYNEMVVRILFAVTVDTDPERVGYGVSRGFACTLLMKFIIQTGVQGGNGAL